jgi:pimeloyl-ACP methyl ester carboxylesterase
VSAIEKGQLRIDGVNVFYRRVPGEGTPTVYCHGNPTHGEDWLPFLESGGPAIAIDMPGWGRSERPDPARFDYSMYGLSAFLEKCLAELGVTRRKLVLHDWGGLALIGAQRRPELVERLVVINAVPLLPGYRWHWIAQLWRRKPIGELLNKTTTKRSLALLLRQAAGNRKPMPSAFVETIWECWDAGTQAALLPFTDTRTPATWRERAATSPSSPVLPWSSGVAATPICRRALPRPTPAPSRRPGSRSSRPPATGPGSTTLAWSIACLAFSADPSWPANGRITIRCPVSRALARIGTKLPQGWGDAGRQLGILVLVDIAYELVRGIADGQRSEAIGHGQQVIDLERSTHLLFEPGLQAFFLPAQGVIDLANQLYLNAQFSIALGFLIWLYLFRNESYYFVRNMFVVSMGFALVGYTLFPTAPPRMFPEHDFVDTITDFSNVNHDSSLAKVFINPYAAVPSMHCAFAAMIGCTGVRVCHHWWSKAWWAFWPLLIAWVVIVTGNHYWVDVALGWMVAGASALVAQRLLARARPQAWSWGRSAQPREAEA